MVLFGFQSSKVNQSLFIRIIVAHSTFVLIYVDTILVTSSDSQFIIDLITKLHKEFSFKDLGLINYFLGLQVTHTSNGLSLSQMKYIRDMLAWAKMQFVEGFSSPMNSGQTLTTFGSDVVPNPQIYKSIAGALQYVTITRPKISFSINWVCQYMHTKKPFESSLEGG